MKQENRLINGFVDLFFLACSFGMFLAVVYVVGAIHEYYYHY